MKRICECIAIGLLTVLLCPLSWGQITIRDMVSSPHASIRAYQELQIDIEHFKSHLRKAPELLSQEEGVQVRLPSPNEGWLTFELYKAPIMAAGMAQRYPQVKSFKGRDVERPERQIRLNMGPRGMFAVVSGALGKFYIHPPGFSGGLHKLYRARETYSNWSCDLDESQLQEIPETPSEQKFQNNCTVLGADLMSYRIVVATTGEFYQLNETGGGMPEVVQALTDRLADMLIPYERDLSMTFILIDSNDIVMYDDPTTDPFSNPTNTRESLDDAQLTIEANFDDADYDIGHGYHEITCGGSCSWAGRAGIAVACRDANKARGYTYQPNDNIDNTVFSHELGHQLSCWHTNYGCGNTGCHRFEPGRGITIMSTSANCGSEDFVDQRVDFFHPKSIDAILEYTLNGERNHYSNNCTPSNRSGWSKCVQKSASGNHPPTVNADPEMKNYAIPIQTPFYLEGMVSDPDGDSWTANWVDYNSDPTQTSPVDQAHDISTAPLFRWYEPDGDEGRYFPKYSTILSGNFVPGQGEILPSVGRTMDFRLIARDNAMPYGALACDEITITVDGNSGPFMVTSPNTGIFWEVGETETVTWAVNNTDQAPINATKVDILLSTDGGATFPTTLASNVTNDGSHSIRVPSSATNTARVRIQPSASEYIFFDISDVDFVITERGCDAVSYQFHPDDPVQAKEGSPALDLEMYFVSVVTGIVDTVNSNGPIANLVTEDQSGDCDILNNTPYHKILGLIFTENGSFTFNRNAGFPLIFNLYLDTFDLNNLCSNFLASNGEHDGSGTVNVSNSYSISLSADTIYEFAVNGFDTGDDRAFDIGFSGPGDVLLEADGPEGYLSEFIIIEDSNGTIESIVTQPDLRSFMPGNYSIQGLNYLSSEDLSAYVGGAFSSLESDLLNGTICGSLSSNTRSVEVQKILNFVNFAPASECRIYPNPSRGQFRISRGAYQMKVFNAWGRVVDDRSNLAANERIGLGFLPSGKYLVQFKSAGEKTITELLIIID